MIKLIVSDFDGTILPYGDKAVSVKVLNKIKYFLDKGVHFAVASGRTYSELKCFFGDLSDRMYFIADDGALTVFKDKAIHRKPFAFQSLKIFFDKSFFNSVSFYSLDSVFALGKFNGQNYGKRIKPIERLFDINEEIYKISAEMSKTPFQVTTDYRVHFKENSFAEFVSPYSNKGVAIANLQLRLAVSRFETMAIGDAANDIPMMNHSSYSVSISDKCSDLKSKCKYNFETIEQAFDLFDKIWIQH